MEKGEGEARHSERKLLNFVELVPEQIYRLIAFALLAASLNASCPDFRMTQKGSSVRRNFHMQIQASLLAWFRDVQHLQVSMRFHFFFEVSKVCKT
jgi:hypothetical protein